VFRNDPRMSGGELAVQGATLGAVLPRECARWLLTGSAPSGPELPSTRGGNPDGAAGRRKAARLL
jgi:hypothetical protein